MKLPSFLLLFHCFLFSCSDSGQNNDIYLSSVDEARPKSTSKVLIEKEKNSTEEVCTHRINLSGDTLEIIQGNKLLKTLTADEHQGIYFGDKKFFRFNNEDFVMVQYVYSGSAYMNYDSVYKIDPVNCNLTPVDIDYASESYAQYLKENQGIWNGEIRKYTDENITTKFFIWEEKDANCCPSIGEVEGRYKLIKDAENKYQLVPDTFYFKAYLMQ